jgi:hypothetical protein
MQCFVEKDTALFSRRLSRYLLRYMYVITITANTLPLLAQQTVATHPRFATPGARVVMDAHNCYPYFEWWTDRIDRALSAGTPLAIEQDLYWYTDPHSGRSWSVVTHGAPASGAEPTLENYFFDTVRPVVEQAIKSGDQRDWPLITLNLDLKSEQPEHLSAILKTLEAHKEWITSAQKSADIHQVQPLKVRPILVLTGDSDAQQSVFYDQVVAGDDVLLFGAVHTNIHEPMAAPDVVEPEPANNYRRWWNNPWSVVEAGGQPKARAWTPEDQARLSSLVKHAHEHNLWIRFYTLDGTTTQELSSHGWFKQYNFGSMNAAKERWSAARNAGVDYIASDQYEELAAFLAEGK